MGRICPLCEGKGSISNPVLYDGIGGAEYIKCGFCKGVGWIHNRKYKKYKKDKKGWKKKNEQGK